MSYSTQITETIPDVARLVNLSGEEDTIDFDRVIAKAKSQGYKLTKSNFDSNNFLMHYKGSYFRIALIDATYSIIANGEACTVYFTEKLRPVTVKNDIGYCIILPIRYEGTNPENGGSVVIEATTKEGEAMTHAEIEELINRRRRQVLVHSVIYYKMDENIVSDSQWSIWAKELYDLQKQYPEIAMRCVYAKEYSDFDPSTGYNLPLEDPWAINKARQLINMKNRKEN